MQEPDTKYIPMRDIRVLNRIRKGAEGIEELAADIRERGLINPITVMNSGQDGYTLIAGLRRLEAIKANGEKMVRATVLTPMGAEELLRMEFAENEQRQGFTVSERLEYAEKIKAIEEAKARERKRTYAWGRDPLIPIKNGEDSERPVHRDTCPYVEKGRARDAVAKQVGLGSGRQYDRAVKVAAERPDLMEKVDKGETTIGRAYKETLSARQAETPTDAPSKPPTQLSNDQVARARHERLMKNPLYAELREKYAEAVKDANLARRERDFKIEGYDKRIRAYDENADYMRRIIDRLEAENAELRKRLGIPPDEKIAIQE